MKNIVKPKYYLFKTVLAKYRGDGSKMVSLKKPSSGEKNKSLVKKNVNKPHMFVFWTQIILTFKSIFNKKYEETKPL